VLSLAGCGSSSTPSNATTAATATASGMATATVTGSVLSTTTTTPTASPSVPSTTATTATAAAPSTTAPTNTTATRRLRARGGPPPGSLPQTHQLPPSTSPGFRREMAALWAGVRTGSAAAAMPAFFPERAYAQVKAIPDPEADYEARLIGDYRLDLAAAHALLGADARTARLIGVEVPGAYAHWVPPGTCYNRIGYYEVPNARVVYREDGRVRSFGIASLISWRGVWYVVHLGAVTRSAATGVVDDPSAGRGVSAASSTC
jgi:hypothetical protein